MAWKTDGASLDLSGGVSDLADSDVVQSVASSGQGDAARTVAVRPLEAEIHQLQLRAGRGLHSKGVVPDEGVPSEIDVVQTHHAVQIRRGAVLDADDGFLGAVRRVEDASFEREVRQRHICRPGTSHITM